MSTPNGSSSSELTMAVLGCGTMGIAILSGILTSLQDMRSSSSLTPSPSGTSTPAEELPTRLPSRFIACVRRPESAKKVKAALAPYPSSSITIVQNDNVAATAKADVILLACKPYMVKDILSEPGMRDALKGKLLISILAGVTVPQMEAIIGADNGTVIVRAMPNTASLIRESMTVIGTSTPPLPAETAGLVTWIFKRIGEVVYLPPTTMDACTALCGSGPAFFALMLEAAIDGAVAMGLPRAEAQRMAAQTMKGAAGLVLNGDHPALLRDKVSTPGGCTIGGLLVLEEGRVRGTVARAVREATVVASQLGKGVQGVNGTRFGGSQLE
ncbi:pyrroline-5-carboxylate reductase dimerization-domain-containing protein [Podospora aff. communis PSN243]|uniref:Pyrroline-5-carboxylate reductase n=1 Tax=Podospora aff. communis PSN243 TaxID=3040156 RepID=A0AAV9G7E3_9PEZI|nr:pyrroline-5-carboxylate reductase dimerization-domain-containing protein [Podospora aff. communis PSN243]